MSADIFCCLCCTSNIKEYIYLRNESGESNEKFEIVVKYFNTNLLPACNHPQCTKERSVICNNCWVHIRDFYNFQQTVIKTRISLIRTHKCLLHDKVKEMPDIPTFSKNNNGNGILALLEEISVEDSLMDIKEEDFQFTSDSSIGFFNEADNISSVEKEIEPEDFNNDYTGNETEAIINGTSISKPLHSGVEEFLTIFASKDKDNDSKILQQTIMKKPPLRFTKEYHASEVLSEVGNNRYSDIHIFNNDYDRKSTADGSEENSENNIKKNDKTNSIDLPVSLDKVLVLCSVNQQKSYKPNQSIHSKANDLLKTKIFPLLQADEITKSIWNDELIVTFGNNLAEKYSLNQYDLIRNILRLIGCFKTEMRKIDPAIKELKDIYKPHLVDKCINAVQNVVIWNTTIMEFETPALAKNLTSLIKKCGKRQRCELIKEDREDLSAEVDNFLLLWEEKSSVFNTKSIRKETSPNGIKESGSSSMDKNIEDNGENIEIADQGNEHFEQEICNMNDSLEQKRLKSKSLCRKHATDCIQNSLGNESEDNLNKPEKSTREEQNNKNLIDEHVNVEKVTVPYSKTNTKKHFCIYCKTLQTTISRHLYLKHKNEKDVRDAFRLPKQSKQRMKIIDKIRKKGDFEHNTSAKHNTGVLIVSRQQQSKFNNNADDYVCCKNCMGFFSKKTFRIHNSRCGATSKGNRYNTIESRQLTQYIHSAASPVLKTKIFPVLRSDAITKAIRYDELVIKFGNYLAEKCSHSQHDSIRANLRLLGRFVIEIKNLEPAVKELKDIYKSHLFYKCIESIRKLANWNEDSEQFESPAVAQNLTCLIKKCGVKLRSELIEEEREELRAEMEIFFLLWEDYIPIINKKTIENEIKQKLVKQGVVSSMDANSSSNKDFEREESCKANISSLSDCIQQSPGNGNADITEKSERSITETKENMDVSLNVDKIMVPYSKKSTKKHFCIYCKTLQTKISRHLYIKHKNEKDVRDAFRLPKHSKQRIKIMDKIRKKGDFEHNTSAKHNTGVLIVSRQQQSKFKNNADDYVCCKNCMGFFSKKTLRKHKSRCGATSKGNRSNTIESRRLTQYIHSAASPVLKTKIFPVLRTDAITKAIRYDELVIKFGNRLAEKYSHSQHDSIRAKLRLLGRFVIEIKKIEPAVKELKDIYKSHLFYKCIESIRKLANWNEDSEQFEIPAVAQHLTCLIKKCGIRLRSELIEEEREELRAEMEIFFLLWEDYIPIMNRKSIENEISQKVVKNVVLSSKEANSSSSEDFEREESCKVNINCIRQSPANGSTKTLEKSERSITEKKENMDVSLNVDKIVVPYSKKSTKKHFCIYCKTLQTKISRHLYLKHKNEKDVRDAFRLPKTSKQRMKIIDKIRKKGDFEHNTSAKHNTGVLIVTRQQQSKFKNNADDYVCCKKCMGFFSKRTYRSHNSRCGATSKGNRYNRIESRRLTQYIHSAASPVLKTKIFPVLRTDAITKAIRYDELVIKFGNYLTEKYSQRQPDLIRANLRLLGRFIIEMKQLDPTIKELKDIYKSHLIGKCIEAIRKVAKWNETLRYFETPAVAQNLTCLIKKCGKKELLQLSEEEHELRAEMENFFSLWHENIGNIFLGYKTAIENPKSENIANEVVLSSNDNNSPDKENISKQESCKTSNSLERKCLRSNSSTNTKLNKNSHSKIKRCRWTDDERDAISSIFGDIRTLKNLPSLKDVLMPYVNRPPLVKGRHHKLKAGLTTKEGTKWSKKLLAELNQPQSSKKRSVMCQNCWVHIRDFYNFQQSAIKTRISLLSGKVEEIPGTPVLSNNSNGELLLSSLYESSVDDLLTKQEEFQCTSNFCVDSNYEYRKNVNSTEKEIDAGVYNNEYNYTANVTEPSIEQPTSPKPSLHYEIEEFQFISTCSDKYNNENEETKTLEQPIMQKSPLLIKEEYHTASALNDDSNDRELYLYDSDDKSNIQKDIDIFNNDCIQKPFINESEDNLINPEKSNREKQNNLNMVDAPLNVEKVVVPYSKNKTKKHFCIYCKTLQTKISTHLYLQHKNEKDVKEAIGLPKKSKERLKIISKIRKKGDFEHNTSAKHNSGVLIVSRQQQSKDQNNADDYVCCKNCMGFFSKKNIRMHSSRCGVISKGERCSTIESRRLTQYIHSAANAVLKTKIFPVLRPDAITKAIRYDELVIKFGNHLAEKNSKSEHGSVRANLRLLGRFLIEMKKLEPAVKELKDIYKSDLFYKCIEAIREVANWNEDLEQFETPALAQNLTFLLKRCGKKLKSELIKEEREELRAELENFFLLWEEYIPIINKKTFEPEFLRSNSSISTQRKSTSPHSKIKRCRWSNDEKQAISTIFGDIRTLKNLPSLKDCSDAIDQSPALSKRTAPQIKSWIDNQRRCKVE